VCRSSIQVAELAGLEVELAALMASITQGGDVDLLVRLVSRLPAIQARRAALTSARPRSGDIGLQAVPRGLETRIREKLVDWRGLLTRNAESGPSGQFSTTANRYVAYRPEGDTTSQLAWYHRDGRRLGDVGAPAPCRQIRLSPSGRRLAIQRGEASSVLGSAGDIWVMDLATGVLSRIINNPAFDGDPGWAPDERSMVFTSTRTGRQSAYRKDLLTGAEAPLVDYPDLLVVDEWSPDGRFVIVRTGGRAAFAVPMTGDRTPRRLFDTPQIIEDQLRVSPDGRWIAFNSDETGAGKCTWRRSRSSRGSGRSPPTVACSPCGGAIAVSCSISRHWDS
jgi:WD40-like Beta Propeller Repeat